MKSVTQTLKTLTLGLTLVYGVSSVAFAADASPADKLMDKTQLMELLREGGLPEGTQKGLSTEGKACELTIGTKAGEEKLSLKASDEDAQQLIFEDYVSDILFSVRETGNGISINQDFSDSSQDVKIEKKSADSVDVTFTESIGYDVRTLTCTFK